MTYIYEIYLHLYMSSMSAAVALRPNSLSSSSRAEAFEKPAGIFALSILAMRVEEKRPGTLLKSGRS